MKKAALLIILLTISGCNNEDENTKTESVRGVKTHLVSATERTMVRRFPTVLEPTSLNILSFDIGGKLTDISLQIGQRVNKGAVLAKLQTETLEIQIRNAEAGMRSAETALKHSLETLERKETLYGRGAITKSERDSAQTDATTRAAQLEQARETVATAQENLSKATLSAPFEGVVNSVEVQSYATVAAGTPIVSLYGTENFEVSFTASFDVVNQLVVGTPAKVRLADRPDLYLDATVSEIGARADTVASFPVVLTLDESDPILKAGMAVEASLELPLPAQEGYSIPLTAIIKEGNIENSNAPASAQVFVYDDETSTLQRRNIHIAGVRENALLVIDGLNAGDRIASAGVSFLRDGQKVKLLEAGE